MGITLQSHALKDLLPTMGIDLARLRTDSTPLIRPIAGAEIMLRVMIDSSSVREIALDVAGVLTGDLT